MLTKKERLSIQLVIEKLDKLGIDEIVNPENIVEFRRAVELLRAEMYERVATLRVIQLEYLGRIKRVEEALEMIEEPTTMKEE